jgi:Putative Ig domain
VKLTMINNGKPRLNLPPIKEAVVLTPKPAPTPRITGAKVFGVRPGSPFQFTITATGDRPMTFSANGLPRGLKLDKNTGQITGKLKKAGEHVVTLRAKNALGHWACWGTMKSLTSIKTRSVIRRCALPKMECLKFGPRIWKTVPKRSGCSIVVRVKKPSR